MERVRVIIVALRRCSNGLRVSFVRSHIDTTPLLFFIEGSVGEQVMEGGHARFKAWGLQVLPSKKGRV